MTILHGDCIDVMRGMDDHSVDAIVTDPPYELSFMGKKWDGSGIACNVDMWREVLRVLKPGGHLLAFGGTRTYHRMACAIEDAGFEIRDCIQWLYGSGFPKSHNVSKAIDKAAGAEREVVGAGKGRTGPAAQPHGGSVHSDDNYQWPGDYDITAPATPEAEQWDGWGTALKPANEPIVLARKPFKGTVANNVLAHGTGALNIDGCRIHTPGSEGVEYQVKRLKPGATLEKSGGSWRPDDATTLPDSWGDELRTYTGKTKDGRWPANVILDECAASELDKQSGVSSSKRADRGKGIDGATFKCANGSTSGIRGHNDSGGASRFFYVAKASKRERNAGLGETVNNHPTVKPVELMRYLVRLVTPPGGTVLDPFAGSGTTGVAAYAEGVRFIGIEQDAEYVEIIRRRMSAAKSRPTLPLEIAS